MTRRVRLTATYRTRRADWATHRAHHAGETMTAALFVVLVGWGIWRDVTAGLVPASVAATAFDAVVAVLVLAALAVEVTAWRRCSHPFDAVGGVECPSCGTHIRARLNHPAGRSAVEDGGHRVDRPRSRYRDV